MDVNTCTNGGGTPPAPTIPAGKADRVFWRTMMAVTGDEAGKIPNIGERCGKRCSSSSKLPQFEGPDDRTADADQQVDAHTGRLGAQKDARARDENVTWFSPSSPMVWRVGLTFF